jgi:hypothetical protein
LVNGQVEQQQKKFTLVYLIMVILRCLLRSDAMEIILFIFYGFAGLVALFFILQYTISNGIDNSKAVKALRSELKEINKQLKNLSEKE